MNIILEVFERDANDVQNRFDIGEYVDVELSSANGYSARKSFRARVLGMTVTPEPFNENAYPTHDEYIPKGFDRE